MTPSESVSTQNGACPVTDAAGALVRRRDVAGISVTEALYAEGTFLPRHCHAHNYFTVVLAGSYMEKHSTREFHWREGALHLLPAGERHENRFTDPTRLLRVAIDPASIQRWGHERALLLSEPREIAGPLAAWLANRIIREFHSQDDIAPLAMEGLLLEILAESARSSREKHGSAAPGWLRRVRDLLQESYLEAPGLTELANIAGVHPVHLSREFHKHYEITIGDFVRARRLEHATELLSRSELSLAEIARTSGFSDQSHFSALFKKHSGLTPAKFRRLSGDYRARPAKAAQ
jgi:AraC family transcriptional regulator